MRNAGRKWCVGLVAVGIVLGMGLGARADTLYLADGRVIENCFIRDEGIRLLVWEKMEDVGTPKALVIPRSQVRAENGYKGERTEAWDAHPDLADLSVTHIEMDPKLAGLHGAMEYDMYGRPVLGGPLKGKAIRDLGEETAMKPAEAVQDLKLKYTPGEEITLTAYVKNVGFKTSKPFQYVWMIDDQEVARGDCGELKEMEEKTFTYKYAGRDGMHTTPLRVVPDPPESATINHEGKEALWGGGFRFYVTNGRVAAWHKVRSAFGTFCWEDYYRWHVDIMNTLFVASVYPATPNGVRARVRLDKVIYCDDIDKTVEEQHRDPKDGIMYFQGAWVWRNDEDTNKKWDLPDKNGRVTTEWSLPHELGHQLGLTDWYFLDYGGDDDHKWPDTGEKIGHFMSHPMTMMHWHGPHLWSEVDAAYFDTTWDKPRGHFGDFYFALPKENYLLIQDVNGLGVPDATVEIYQRGTVLDPNGQGGEDQGVRYAAVVEDGEFEKPMSKDPVIVGKTDPYGMMHLPNRPVKEVVTFNGFHRQPNPFGNINVVGERGLMLAKVTKNGRSGYYFIEVYDFNVAWFRGYKDKFVMVLRTPFGSASSPVPPRDVRVTQGGWHDEAVRITWNAPEVRHEQHYLERVTGYRVYRRFGPQGMSDRPWFPIATLGPTAREFVAELKDRPYDTDWFSQGSRFAVTTIGDDGVESEMAEVVLPDKKPQ